MWYKFYLLKVQPNNIYFWIKLYVPFFTVASTIGSIIVDGRMYPPNNYNSSNGSAPNVNNNSSSSNSSTSTNTSVGNNNVNNSTSTNSNAPAMLSVPPPSNQSQPPSVRHYASPPQHPASAPASVSSQQAPPAPPYHNRVSPLQGMAQMPNQLAARTLHRSNSNPQPPHHSQQGTHFCYTNFTDFLKLHVHVVLYSL